jgi:ribosome-associated heat shock protein Hsp15
MDSVRIDKWLWAARFFKTRSLATDEVNKGHVQIAKQNIKPSREVRLGDILTVWQVKIPRTITVKGVSTVRGPAPVAQALYEESAESISARLAMQDRHCAHAFNIRNLRALDHQKVDMHPDETFINDEQPALRQQRMHIGNAPVGRIFDGQHAKVCPA